MSSGNPEKHVYSPDSGEKTNAQIERELLSTYYDWTSTLGRISTEPPITFVVSKQIDKNLLKVFLGHILHAAYTIKPDEIEILRAIMQSGLDQLDETRKVNSTQELTDILDFGKPIAQLTVGIKQLERLIPDQEVDDEWRNEFRIMLLAILKLMQR